MRGNGGRERGRKEGVVMEGGWKGVAMATGMFRGPSLPACLPAKPGWRHAKSATFLLVYLPLPPLLLVLPLWLIPLIASDRGECEERRRNVQLFIHFKPQQAYLLVTCSPPRPSVSSPWTFPSRITTQWRSALCCTKWHLKRPDWSAEAANKQQGWVAQTQMMITVQDFRRFQFCLQGRWVDVEIGYKCVLVCVGSTLRTAHTQSDGRLVEEWGVDNDEGKHSEWKALVFTQGLFALAVNRAIHCKQHWGRQALHIMDAHAQAHASTLARTRTHTHT